MSLHTPASLGSVGGLLLVLAFAGSPIAAANPFQLEAAQAAPGESARQKPTSLDPAVRKLEVSKVRDQAVLGRVAMSDTDAGVRWTAIVRLFDEQWLAKVVATEPLASLRLVALVRIQNPQTLRGVADLDPEPTARSAAACKLQGKSPECMAPPPLQGEPRALGVLPGRGTTDTPSPGRLPLVLRYSDGPYEILGQKTLTREFQGLAEYAPKPDFMADSFLALPPTEVRPLLQLLDDRRARATLEDWARKLGATRILVLGGSTEDRSVDRPEVDARFQGFQQGRDWAVSMFAFGDQPWLQTTDNRPSGKTPTGLPEAVKRRIRIEFLAIRKK